MVAALLAGLLLITMVPSPTVAAAEGDWRQLEDMPSVEFGFSFATLDDDKVFVSMGLVNVDVFEADSYSNRTWIFDPATDEWTPVSDSPKAYVGARAVAMPDGNVYMFGGVRMDTQEVQGKVLIYNVMNDEWSTGTDDPGMIFTQVAALDETRIMLMGGDDAATNDIITDCYVYDIVADDIRAADDLPNELTGGVAVNSGGTIYYIGGSDSTLIAQDEVWRYDASVNNWGFHGRMPEGRYLDGGVIAGDGLVYMYGGKTGDTTNSQNRGTFKVLDLADCSFVPVPDPPMQLAGGGVAATSDGRLMLFGGAEDDQMSNYSTSLRLFEKDAWLGSEECAPGGSVRLFMSVNTMYAENSGFQGTALLKRNGTIFSSYDVISPTGGPTSVLMSIPEDLSPGDYDVVIVDAGTSSENSALSFETMTLTITDAPTPTDRIGELEDQLDSLKEQLEGKMDAWVGYVLLIITIASLLSLVMSIIRKK